MRFLLAGFLCLMALAARGQQSTLGGASSSSITNVITVDPNATTAGRTYNTIGAAMTASWVGAVIQLEAGNYTGETLANGISLKENQVLRGRGRSATRVVYSVNANDGTEICDLWIDNGATLSDRNVKAYTNVYVHDIRLGSPGMAAQIDGFFPQDAAQVYAYNCTIYTAWDGATPRGSIDIASGVPEYTFVDCDFICAYAGSLFVESTSGAGVHGISMTQGRVNLIGGSISVIGGPSSNNACIFALTRTDPNDGSYISIQGTRLRWQNGTGTASYAIDQGLLGSQRIPVVGWYVTDTGIVYCSTNNTAVSLATLPAAGTDQAGTAMTLSAGIGTGTGRGGAFSLQTSPSLATGVLPQALQTRHYIPAKEVTLTESSATLVGNFSVASGKTIGVRIVATTRANDGTDFQARTDDFVFAAVNKAGTVTASTPSSATTSAALSSGTLSATWTAVANGNGVDLKCNAVSSLTQTTLVTTWRAEIDSNGTPTVTPQ